jgi:hypothetical protein
LNPLPHFSVEDVIAVSDKPINKVLDSVEDYSQRGDEYRTKCLSHNGTSDDSLSIKEAQNGDVLLHCHAGCENEEVVEALGLNMTDLFSKNGHSSLPVTKPARTDLPADVIAVDELPGSIDEYFGFKDADDNLLYVQRHKGAFYRVVGFDEDEDPLFAKGLEDVEQTLFELPALLKAASDGETIIHTEGCKDALNVAETLGLPATTSGGAKTWKGEFAENYRGAKKVLILPDKDEEGAAYARQVAQDLLGVVETVKIVDLPGLPEKGDVSDWLEAGHTAEEFFKIAERTEALDPRQAWPEKPTPLEIKLPGVEAFDGTLLPEPLRAWVLDVAKRMDNAAPDFAATAAIVQAGALLGRKVGIYPKRHDDWIVIPNLWGGAVGPPSSMKSPALEAAIKPTKRLAALAKEAYEEALKAHEIDKMVAAAEKGALKKQLEDKAKAVASGNVARSEMDDTREKLGSLEEPEEPVQKRYLTNDITIEKLAEILSMNPDGILYFSDELMRFLKGLDRVGREADRAFFLEAWNGNGSFEVDRIGRGSIHVPALCISLLGGIQPGPLTKYVGDALAEAEKADGLLQRFQVLVYPDMRAYEPSDVKPDQRARNRAYQTLEDLAGLDVEKFGAHQEDDEVPGIHFSKGAQAVFDAWRSEVEPRYRTGEYPEAIESHILKYRSLFASLALIFEAVDFVAGASEGGEVSEENALRAAGWCSYLESHVHRIYSPLIASPERRAHTLLEHIQVGDVRHGSKAREIQRKGWPGLTTAQELGEALDILVSLGWVRRVTVKPPGRGRSSEQIHVHPGCRD